MTPPPAIYFLQKLFYNSFMSRTLAHHEVPFCETNHQAKGYLSFLALTLGIMLHFVGINGGLDALLVPEFSRIVFVMTCVVFPCGQIHATSKCLQIDIAALYCPLPGRGSERCTSASLL
jgi:hypothetical protein